MSSIQSDGSTCVSTKNFCTTKLKSHEAFLSWTIENFDFHEKNGLTFTENLQPVFGKFTLDFLNQDEKVLSHYISFVDEYTSFRYSYGFPDIPKEGILSDNKLKICVHVTFSVKNNFSDTYTDQFKFEFPENTIIENYASLFENREFTDVVICVGEKEYPVHKSILAARSPVFAAMFRHDTEENQLNRVNIEDVDENVMDALLKYIYTGKCENLDSLVGGLLAAADKYALDHLKVSCSKKLQEMLSVENAANILLLSEMHHVNQLKKEVIRFIVDKPKEVFDSDGWKDMLSNFLLIDEVCRAMALRYK